MRTDCLHKILSILLICSLVGCGKSANRIMGKSPGNGTILTVAALKTAPKSQSTLVSGEMIEKCPVAGCWFELRDKSGVVHVDTKAAGFVVSTIPLHTKMTVAGKVIPGSPPSLAATGIQY